MSAIRQSGFDRAMAATGIVIALGSLLYFATEPDPAHDSTEPPAISDERPPLLSHEVSAPIPPPRQSSYRPPSAGRHVYTMSDADRVGVPQGPTAEVVAKLTPMAEAGDARAALALYHKLMLCRASLSTSANSKIIDVYAKAGVDTAKYLQELEAEQSDCAGSMESIEQRGRWLEQAAASGLLEAQLMYLSDAEAIVGRDPSAAIRNPEKAREFKTKGLGYLDHLVRTGNIDAMLSMAEIYDAGFIVSRDPVRAYAMSRLADMAQPGLVPQALSESRRNNLSREDQMRAERIAQDSYRACCGR